MITIKHCQDYIEANIYKSKLEDAGIICFLENELANFTPYNSFMNQDVKLVVNEKDVQEALEILNISNPNAIFCPNCNSLKYIFNKKYISKNFYFAFSNNFINPNNNKN